MGDCFESVAENMFLFVRILRHVSKTPVPTFSKLDLALANFALNVKSSGRGQVQAGDTLPLRPANKKIF